MVNIVQGQKKQKQKRNNRNKKKNIIPRSLRTKKARYSSHTLNEESIHNQQEGEP